MRNQKKSFWLLALVSALAIGVGFGCDDTNEKEKNDPKATKPTGKPKGSTEEEPVEQKEVYYEWRKLDKANTLFDDAKLTDMVESGGQFYFGTDGEGLVIWEDPSKEKAGFTALKGAAGLKGKKGDGTGAATVDISGTAPNTDKTHHLVSIGSKEVAFATAGGIGVVKNKTLENSWAMGGAGTNVPAQEISAMYVAQGANDKFLHAASAVPAGANSILHQKIGGLADAWNNATGDTAGALDKPATCFGEADGISTKGDLLVCMNNSAGEAGIKVITKAGAANGIGGATPKTTTANNAHFANLSADGTVWKKNAPALAVAMHGKRLVVATANDIITFDDASKAAAPVLVTAAKIHTTSAHPLTVETDGFYVYTKDKGRLFVKASDGKLDDTKALGVAGLKTNFDVKADNTDFAKADFSNNIIASKMVGDKEIIATGDKGLIVREKKERNKKK